MSPKFCSRPRCGAAAQRIQMPGCQPGHRPTFVWLCTPCYAEVRAELAAAKEATIQARLDDRDRRRARDERVVQTVPVRYTQAGPVKATNAKGSVETPALGYDEFQRAIDPGYVPSKRKRRRRRS